MVYNNVKYVFSISNITQKSYIFNRFFVFIYGDFIMRENLALQLLKDTNIDIHRALFVKLDSNWNFTSSGTVISRLYFVTKGSGFIKAKDQYVELKEGFVYLIPPSCKFSCGCDYMEKIFFHFALPTPEKYDLFLNTEKIYKLPYSLEKMDNIKALLKTDSFLDILKLKYVITETVISFCDTYFRSTAEIKKHSQVVQKIISYIDENLSIKLSVADISKALFLSESKIRNDFKNEIGLPIGKYIDDMVFIKARKLLLQPNTTISSVSSELGFCDQFYFSRRFSEKIGRTPTKFKSENKIS